MTFALVGNQNCGKTALFNALTGSNQHVGNFPGVTVDSKIGEVKDEKNCFVVDLPGIYSIRPYTSEEIVTRDFVLNEKPDGIINITDATNIERNLYLTLQLLTLGIPTVLVLNMMDEVRNNGGTINVGEMSALLGVPVVPVSAIKNEGISDLKKIMTEMVKFKMTPKVRDFCPSGPVHRCIHAVSHLIEDHAEAEGISARFCAVKIIEGDESLADRLALDKNEKEMIEHSIIQMETERGLDRNAALADMRYNFIEDVCKKTVIRAKESKEHIRSRKIDSVLTNRFLAIPVFVLIMLFIFWLTFDVIGQRLSDLLSFGISSLSNALSGVFTNFGINPVVHSLIIDGIFEGVGSVLSFLPIIVVLFFFLSILEDTGYMARVAFVMDKLLRKIGLSGKSFVPMLIGFGCSVPAIMAARTLSSERDRKMTVMLTPFMSCSAKIPIYAFFTAAFFENHRALVMISLYLGSMAVGVIAALLFKNTIFKGKSAPFVMELPNYRLPSLKSVMLLLWEKAKDFLSKAFTVIFIATIVVWFLQKFDYRINVVENPQDSMLASLGNLIAPVFAPLGFGDWRAATGLVSGIIAKEAVVSTLETLAPTISAVFLTKTAAASFLTFTVLYTPCIAAIATIRREMNSTLKTAGIVIFQCVTAWLAAFAVYRIGTLVALL